MGMATGREPVGMASHAASVSVGSEEVVLSGGQLRVDIVLRPFSFTIRRAGRRLLRAGGAWAADGTNQDQFVQFTEGVIAHEVLTPAEPALRARAGASARSSSWTSEPEGRFGVGRPTVRSFYPRRVHFGELTGPEQRVLGCLIEKRWTTPDQYPLSLNSLRLACNQSTNRDPVTDYSESTVRDAAQRLAHYGLARLASYHGSRATKYRHLAEEGLGLDREQLAILAVLLLRGPQTPGELKGRSGRMAQLDSLADVERVLASLTERRYVRRIARRPGQKEDRFEQLLGGEGSGEIPVLAPTAAPASSPAPAPSLAPAPSPAASGDAGRDDGLARRVTALEEEVARLRAELAELLGP